MTEAPLVVLVETMGSANLGAVCRSVAAYGLEGIRLVSPRCEIDEETKKWACYGKRVFAKIEVFEDLHSALSDVGFAVALSRRDGKDRHKHYPLPYLAEKTLPDMSNGRLAFVFGNEESGLARSHLKACHCSAEIPVVADDGSLNLAHAVSITLYEWLGRSLDRPIPERNQHEKVASNARLQDLLKRCEALLKRVGYPRHRSSLEEEVVKLQAIMARSRLEEWEVRLMFGMIRQIQYRLDHPQ